MQSRGGPGWQCGKLSANGGEHRRSFNSEILSRRLLIVVSKSRKKKTLFCAISFSVLARSCWVFATAATLASSVSTPRLTPNDCNCGFR